MFQTQIQKPKPAAAGEPTAAKFKDLTRPDAGDILDKAAKVESDAEAEKRRLREKYRCCGCGC